MQVQGAQDGGARDYVFQAGDAARFRRGRDCGGGICVGRDVGVAVRPAGAARAGVSGGDWIGAVGEPDLPGAEEEGG